jgi:tetraacyldisaccharide 4'-kinase
MNEPPFWAQPFLLPVSWLYAWLLRFRRQLYARGFLSSFRLPGQVISIGNIEAGGTGKSPLTIEICEVLRARGARPAILTRGYRSGLSSKESAVLLGTDVLQKPQNSLSFFADEGRMQAARLGDVPIIVGSDRWFAAQRYLEHHPAPTHWILDDGFQHLRLQRDFDIVLLDANDPFGNGNLLPAGSLREMPSTLKKADWVIFTRAGDTMPQDDVYGRPTSAVRFVTGNPRSIKDRGDWLQVKSWVLASGIARPERLEADLRERNFPLAEVLRFPDHETFDKTLVTQTMKKAEALVTTEKDYWRERSFFDNAPFPVYVLPLTLDWLQDDGFPKILDFFTKN